METKFRGYLLKGKYLLFLFLLLIKNIKNDNNEITIIINQTIGKDIINIDYFDYISEIVVNGKSGNISNYVNLYSEEINEITIKFNRYLDNCNNMFCCEFKNNLVTVYYLLTLQILILSRSKV